MAYLQTLNFMNIYMLGGAAVAGAAGGGGDGDPPKPPDFRFTHPRNAHVVTALKKKKDEANNSIELLEGRVKTITEQINKETNNGTIADTPNVIQLRQRIVDTNQDITLIRNYIIQLDEKINFKSPKN